MDEAAMASSFMSDERVLLQAVTQWATTGRHYDAMMALEADDYLPADVSFHTT
jgi:hypothetical protein